MFKNLIKVFLIIFLIFSLLNFGLINEKSYANGLPSEVWVDDDYDSSTPGWGTTHFAKIQDGIDGVAEGGIVNVYPGTYNESITINKSSISMIGDPGDPNVIGPGPNAPILDGSTLGGNKPAFNLSSGVTDITIKGFIIQNYGPNGNTNADGIVAWCKNPPTSNIIISNNHFRNLGYAAILTGNEGSNQGVHDNWLIEYNLVENMYAYGFDLENIKNSQIIYNKINNTGSYGLNIISVVSQNTIPIVTENNIVSNNIIENTGYYAINLMAWAWSGYSGTSVVKDITVKENTVNASSGAILAWKVGSGTLDIQNINIEKNNITIENPSPGSSGVYYAVNLGDVGGVSYYKNNDLEIKGTLGSGTFYHGINITGTSTGEWNIEDNNIIGNYVGTDSVGIRLRGFLPSTSKLNILNNRIEEFSRGIRSDALPSGITVKVNYNLIMNNTNYGISNENGEIIDAKYNWWGDESGPSENGPGTGDAVSTNVLYSPWLVPNIFVTKSDSPDPVAQGMPLTYTINWTMGSTWATWDGTTVGTTTVNIPTGLTFGNVTLKDTLPSQVTFVSCTGGGTHASGVVTWNLGTYTPGNGGTVTVNTTVNLKVPDGSISNSVEISYDSLKITDTEITTVQEGAGGVYNFYDSRTGAYILFNTNGTGWRIVIPSIGYDTGWKPFDKFHRSSSTFTGNYADSRYKFIITFTPINRYKIIFNDRFANITIKIAD